MKRMFYVLNISVFMILILASCEKDESSFEELITAKEQMLELQAPSGEYIAPDIETLKSKLAPILEYSFGESKDFEVISIQYDSLSLGFSAEIEYRTLDGFESNVIVKKFAKKIVKTRAEDNYEIEGYSYSCKQNKSGKCKKCRLVNDKKHDQVRCACDDGLVEGCSLYEYSW